MIAKPKPGPTPSRAENADALGVPPIPTEIDGVAPAEMTPAQRAVLIQFAADRFGWLVGMLGLIAQRSPEPLSSRTLRQSQKDAHDTVVMLFFAVDDLMVTHGGAERGAPRSVRNLMAALQSLTRNEPHPLFARNSDQFDADQTSLRKNLVKGVAAAVLQHLVDNDDMTQRQAAEKVSTALGRTQFKTGERNTSANAETVRGWHKRALSGNPSREPLAAHFNSTLAKFRANSISTDDALKALSVADTHTR